MAVKNDVWRVRINHVTVAIVHIPDSDTNWNLISRFQEMVSAADPTARVTLASDANERGVLV